MVLSYVRISSRQWGIGYPRWVVWSSLFHSFMKNVICTTHFMRYFLTYHPSIIGWGMDPTLTWAHTPSNGGWMVCQKMFHKKSVINNITLLLFLISVPSSLKFFPFFFCYIQLIRVLIKKHSNISERRLLWCLKITC